MIDVTFDYWNKLADQIILISSLLSGFSIAVISNFLVSDTNTRLSRYIMTGSILAASFFLITVFAMTKLLMITTNGFPLEITENDLTVPRIIGSISFFLGIISLISMISLSGWTKSKKMGRLTTIIGVLTFIIIMIMLS